MTKLAIVLIVILAFTQVTAIVLLSRMISELDEKHTVALTRLGAHLSEKEQDDFRKIDMLSRSIESVSRDVTDFEDRLAAACREVEKVKLFAYRWLPVEADQEEL